MALIDTLLSRLLMAWRGKKAAPQEPPKAEEPRQAAQERPRADDQETTRARKPSPAWEQAELRLPPEHPLSKLWEGHARKHGAPLPAPRLSFAPLLERLRSEEAEGGDGSAGLTGDCAAMCSTPAWRSPSAGPSSGWRMRRGCASPPCLRDRSR